MSHSPIRCMTRAMNPRMRMSFNSIRPGLASRSTLMVTLARPPPINHHHRLPPIPHHPRRPRGRIRSVLLLSSRTGCLTSRLISRPCGMRPRSTGSSLVKMWRPSEMTCAWSWPTRRPSSASSSSSKTSSPKFSPSSSLYHRPYSDLADPQGSFFTLSYSFIDIRGNVLTCLGGFGDVGLFCSMCVFCYFFIF